MEGNEEPQTSERGQCIKVGDTVHVYNGTSSGTRAFRTMAYIGTVVGYDELAMKWLVCVVFILSCLAFSVSSAIYLLSFRVQVRNTMLARKGQPNRVEEAFMSRSLFLSFYLPLSLYFYLSLSLSLFFYHPLT